MWSRRQTVWCSARYRPALRDDIDLAVQAARKALDAGSWGKMAAVDRGRALSRLADLISANAEELAALESRDTGKPVRQGVADIAGCARYFEYYGGAADKIHGETIRSPVISWR